MKNLLLIVIILLNYTAFSNHKKEVSLPDYWEFVSITKDSNIQKGHSKIKLLITDKYSETPLRDTKVFIDTNLFVGQTDSLGALEGFILSGQNRFCADTPEGNSFTANYNFLSQHYYVVRVRMDRYKTLELYENGVYPIADKPVIYLYPTKKQNINVQVSPKNEFLFTYPQYPNGGWKVAAHPNGKIDYNNKTYNYLFWEGNYPPIFESQKQKGFVVNSDTLVQFFENTLTTIGLNNLEQADFITYWGPKMMENQLNFVHFYFNDEIEAYVAKLKISPAPKTLIRVFMTYHGLNEEEFIEPQTIPSYVRNGFTAVEWGGSYH